MIGGLLGRLWPRRVAEGLRATGEELRDQLASVREKVLDETDELARDGDELAERIRRNARKSRGAFGERPL